MNFYTHCSRLWTNPLGPECARSKTRLKLPELVSAQLGCKLHSLDKKYYLLCCYELLFREINIYVAMPRVTLIEVFFKQVMTHLTNV